MRPNATTRIGQKESKLGHDSPDKFCRTAENHGENAGTVKIPQPLVEIIVRLRHPTVSTSARSPGICPEGGVDFFEISRKVAS